MHGTSRPSHMRYLAELVRIRGVSLDVLMEELEIHPPAYA